MLFLWLLSLKCEEYDKHHKNKRHCWCSRHAMQLISLLVSPFFDCFYKLHTLKTGFPSSLSNDLCLFVVMENGLFINCFFILIFV